MMKTLIIGLGNPILTDDGVGIKAARLMRELINNRADIDITEVYAGGIRLMEAMEGYEKAVVIDAMVSGRHRPGHICRMTLQGLICTKNLLCTHDGSLEAALEIGRLGGLSLPSEIVIWGIEALDVEGYSEELTEDVERAVPKLVEMIMQELQ